MPLSGLYLICGSSPLKTKVIPVPLIQCPVGYAEIAKVIPFKEFPVCNFFKGVRDRQTEKFCNLILNRDGVGLQKK